VQFAFVSDAAYSDADGLYLSVGGAFAVDDVMIMDYPSATLFLDDADANVFMTTSVPPSAGNYWSLRNSPCQAFSGTQYWGITFPDTTAVPANLNNWLRTPTVDISSYEHVVGCTLWFVQQMFMSGSDGGSWQELATDDGGATWTVTGWWYGHQCQFSTPGGPCAHYQSFIPIIDNTAPRSDMVAGEFRVLTDGFGNGCDQPNCSLGYCSAGITIDDCQIEVSYNTPVERSSWGRIKSFYR
jgi:hypothetical protein